jgi:hypothetical protein
MRKTAATHPTRTTPTRHFIVETEKCILENGEGIWTDVYHRLRDANHRGIIIAALVPEARTEHILEVDDWGLDPRDLRPGCVKFGDGRIVYYRNGSDDGYEPLMLEREFGGVKPSCLEIAEEFRLYHNLYFDLANGKYIKVMDDGTEHDVVRVTPDKVSIRTTEIRQFLAIKEMRLALLFDLHREFPEKLDVLGCNEEFNAKQGQDFRYRYTIRDSDFGKGPFVRIWGKRVIQGFQRDECGIWPFTERDEEDVVFPDFIIGVDKNGKNILAPCDPHGGQYLTPVYFRSEVLNRYYDAPTKYSVEDGYLRCGTLWGIEIHNDEPDYVTAFLGDLGRDLPESERPYWRSFNIPPAGTMSETAFRRSILAEFTDPTRPDLVFKQAFPDFQTFWEKKHGWPLFRPLSDEDSHCFTSLRIPATPEQGEFDRQIMHLTKILIDSLNEAQIAKEIACAPGDKGITKLEQYLKPKNLPDCETHIRFLRDLQSLRSEGAAHRKGDNYEKTAKKLGLNQKDRRVVFTEFLNSSIALLTVLQRI